MGAKEEKLILSFLEEYGYEPVRRNVMKHKTIFGKPGYPDVSLNDRPQDHVVRKLMDEIKKRHGVRTTKQAAKRDVSQIKDRKATERARLGAERDRLRAELDSYVSTQDERLGDISSAEWSTIWREMERRENEIRELERLMTDVPTANAHSGRVTAQHRS